MSEGVFAALGRGLGTDWLRRYFVVSRGLRETPRSFATLRFPSAVAQRRLRLLSIGDSSLQIVVSLYEL